MNNKIQKIARWCLARKHPISRVAWLTLLLIIVAIPLIAIATVIDVLVEYTPKVIRAYREWWKGDV